MLWYHSFEAIECRTPSRNDEIEFETEARYRKEGARFIMDLGNKLGLRYLTMATGIVFYHRFYMHHSFKEFPRWVIGATCLFLAGKVEETPKKCRDILKYAQQTLSDNQFKLFGENPREEVMISERILLQTIKFDLQTNHPYEYLLKYGKLLKGEKSRINEIVQKAWIFINDSLSTPLCLVYRPQVIALAVLMLAFKLSNQNIKEYIHKSRTDWWKSFYTEVDETDLDEICKDLTNMYEGKPPRRRFPNFHLTKSKHSDSVTNSPKTPGSPHVKKQRLESQSSTPAVSVHTEVTTTCSYTATTHTDTATTRTNTPVTRSDTATPTPETVVSTTQSLSLGEQATTVTVSATEPMTSLTPIIALTMSTDVVETQENVSMAEPLSTRQGEESTSIENNDKSTANGNENQSNDKSTEVEEEGVKPTDVKDTVASTLPSHSTIASEPITPNRGLSVTITRESSSQQYNKYVATTAAPSLTQQSDMAISNPSSRTNSPVSPVKQHSPIELNQPNTLVNQSNAIVNQPNAIVNQPNAIGSFVEDMRRMNENRTESPNTVHGFANSEQSFQQQPTFSPKLQKQQFTFRHQPPQPLFQPQETRPQQFQQSSVRIQPPQQQPRFQSPQQQHQQTPQQQQLGHQTPQQHHSHQTPQQQHQQTSQQPHLQQTPPQQQRFQQPNIQMQQQFRQRQPSPQTANFVGQQQHQQPRPNPLPFQISAPSNFQSPQSTQHQSPRPRANVPRPTATQATPLGIGRNQNFVSQPNSVSNEVRPSPAPAPILDHMSSFFQNSPSSFNQNSVQPRTPQLNKYPPPPPPGNMNSLTPGSFQQTTPQNYHSRNNFSNNQPTPGPQTYTNYGSPRLPIHQNQNRAQQPKTLMGQQVGQPRQFMGGFNY